jgi:hypothetical protein
LDIQETRAGMTATMDAIGDRVSPGRMVERRKNRMMGSIRSARNRVMGSAEHGVDEVRETAHQATEAVKDMPDTIRERTEGAPMVAGAVAFGLGFLVASVLPQPKGERQAEGKLLEKAEPVK